MYDPLASVDDMTITRRRMWGSGKLEADRYLVAWQRLDGSTWRAVDGDGLMDYDVEVAGDGSLTVHRDLMGAMLSLRCLLRFASGADPETVAADETCPMETVTVRRRLAAYEYAIEGLPVRIPPGTTHVGVTAAVTTNKVGVEDFDRVLLPLWYVARNFRGATADTLQYQLAGHGKTATLCVMDAVDEELGAAIGLDMVDTGPLRAWQNADGKILTDNTGVPLVF